MAAAIKINDKPKKLYPCPKCDLTFRSSTGHREHIRFVHLGINFPCSSRTKVFNSKHHLLSHSKIHLKVLPFKCANCVAAFATATALDKHRKSHKNDAQKKLECELCGKRFQHASALTDHVTNHLKERPQKCSTCGKSFKKKASLRIHQKIHVYTKKVHKCPHCPSSYQRTSYLNSHIRYVHSTRKCKECNQIFPNLASFRKHVRKFHTVRRPMVTDIPNECLFCGKVVKNKHSLEVHMCTHTHEKPFLCDTCGAEFGTYLSRQNHQETVHSEQLFPCNACSAVFKTKSGLWNHATYQHDRNAQHVYVLCNKKFSRLSDLEKHIASRHTKERPHKCDTCQASFVTTSQLNNHKKCHLGDAAKIHECPTCNKKFSDRGQLRIHMRIHDNQRKMFPCSMCDLPFKTGTGRRYHMDRIHQGIRHSCLFCEKVFRQQKALDDHIRGYICEYLFYCEDCGRGFVDKSVFQNHKQSHLRDAGKSQQCRVCDRKYFTREELRRHMWRQHKKKVGR